MLDKAEGLCQHYMAIKDIDARLAKHGLTSRLVRLKSGRWGYQLGPSEWDIYVTPDSMERKSARVLITNPSRFRSFSDYEKTLKAILTRNDYEHIRLTRLDLAVDSGLGFEQIRQRVRIKFKQHGHSFHAKSGTQTGITIGSRPEQVCVYNKAREQKLTGENWTRIEIRLWRQKLPVEFLHQLPRIIHLNKAGQPFAPFDKVMIDDFELKSHRDYTRRSDIIRVTQLSSLIDCIGYQQTRRFLNQDGKFNQKFGRYIEIRPPLIDLNVTLRRQLKRYFADKPRGSQ